MSAPSSLILEATLRNMKYMDYYPKMVSLSWLTRGLLAQRLRIDQKTGQVVKIK